jgi:uncharacterized membrane protein
MSRISQDVTWVLIGTLVATAFALVGAPEPLRVAPGLAAVLFLPGYALSIALFPEREFDTPERGALAFGLSLAVVAILGIPVLWDPLRFEYLPLIGLPVATVGFCLVAEWRRRAGYSNSMPAAPASGELSRAGARLRGVPFPVVTLLAIFTLGGATVAYVLFPSAPVTEFYTVEAEGLMQDRPRQITAGEESAIDIGIVHDAATSETYRVTVMIGSDTVGSAGPITFDRAGEWRGTVDFNVPAAGLGQELTAVLYRGDSQEPYRLLRLWIDAAPAQ